MKYLPLLKNLANKSNHHQHRVSCIIVDKNKIVSAGYGQIKTNPKSNHPYHMIHAELHALFKTEDVKGCTAYLFRENRQGELCLSKPCPTCEEALKLAGIKKVVFTNANDWETILY